MKKALPVFVLFIFALSVFGQQQTPTPEASPNQESDVVKISTTLVQLDLIVVDKEGKQVRNLAASDFTVLEDGKPQKITNLSYVNTSAGQSAEPVKLKEKVKDAPLAPPVKITPANAGRMITFIVDDGNCSASYTGMNASRQGIEKFIREQMQPTDRVAIYQTRAGTSTFQQYTNDKARLLKIAGKIHWRPSIGSCSSNDGSFFPAARSNTFIKQSTSGPSTQTIETDSVRKTREHLEDTAANNQIDGTLGVIRYVLQGLKRVPGRKMVFLLSDGIPLRDRGGRLLSAVDALRDLTDFSNRASVVFNVMDVRGVFDEGMIEARDEVYGQDDIRATDNIRTERFNAVSNSRDGLAFLAHETGGKFTHSQNYLDGAIKQNLEVETGYYLIAYEPSDETFKGKKFNKIKVTVNQPGLKVVSRAGFFGSVEEVSKPKRKSESSDLYEAIAAPLPSGGLDIGLTAYFVNSLETGNVVRSLFHLDGKEITFVDDKDGMKKASIDVVAVTFDEKNRVVDEFTRGHTFKIDPASMPLVIQNGLIYSTDVIVKKPGTYNFRVAVKDNETKQIGSSSKMVEIPDLKKSRIFVSGLTLSDVDKDGKFAVPAAVKSDNAISLTASGAVPAVRRFRRGSIIAYAYTVYNARLDPASGQPKLSAQIKLFRNGQVVIDGTPQNSQLEKQPDWTRTNDYAYLRLNPQIEPGEYSLQIIIKDLIGEGKNATTSESVDFEVIE